jgi:UDP-glucose 4-epimerase
MRVLVTGGAGYVGSVVVRELLQAGHHVVALDNLSQGHRAALRGCCHLVEADVGDYDLVRALLHSYAIQAVVHLAAATVVARSVTEPRLFFEENCVKGLRLLNAMMDAGVQRLIFSSTASVYGHPRYTPIDEDHPLTPVTSYGASKLAFEMALDSYHHAYGLRFVTFRFFNAAGALPGVGEDHRPETHVIPAILGAALGLRPPFPVYGTDYDTPDGTCIRDYVHVRDLAQAHVLALAKVDTLGRRVYNLGSGAGLSVFELVRQAERLLGVQVPLTYCGPRPGDPSILTASAERARKELGWTTPHSHPAALLTSAWEWLRSHPEGYS